MTRNVFFRSTFTSGEVSPLLRWRLDYQRTQTGVRSVNGFLPLREGGMMRAPGTVHWDVTRENGPCRIIPFEFNAQDAVLLEFYPNVMRVRRYGALVMDGESPYELETPYDADAIGRLSWVQSADVIYFADGSRPIQKLSRFALNNWAFSEPTIDGGPFKSTNTDKAKKVTPSAATGTITLTADFDIFVAEHVGSLFRIEAEEWPNVAIWQGSITDMMGVERMRNDGKVYRTLTDYSGLVAPIHEEGIEQTMYYPPSKWEYISTTDGIVRITAVAGPRSATAHVIRRVPEPLGSAGAYATAPTYRWAEGAWSERNGYPSVLALYDQRMFAAHTASDPRTIWPSAVGSYLDFAEGTRADDAIGGLIIDGDGSLNPIRWLSAGSRALHIGAMAEEYSLRATSDSTAVAIDNARISRDSSKGSSPMAPVTLDGSPIFISRDQRRLFEITYVIERDANIARELSFPARHFGAARFEQVVHQGEPMALIWLRRESGDLLAVNYNRDEDVLGWSAVSVAGGHVETMAVTRAASDDASILVLVVRRTINGETKRSIEAMAPPPGWDFIPAGDVPATHLFNASVFVPDVATDTFSVPQFAGHEVTVWADNQHLGLIIVGEDGMVTLPYAVERAEIGLFDTTHYFDTMDPASSGDGAVPGAKRRIEKLPAIQIFATQQGIVQTITREFGREDRVSAPVFLISESVASEGRAPMTGEVCPVLSNGFDADMSLRFRPHGGAALTVTAITAILKKEAI